MLGVGRLGVVLLDARVERVEPGIIEGVLCRGSERVGRSGEGIGEDRGSEGIGEGEGGSDNGGDDRRGGSVGGRREAGQRIEEERAVAGGPLGVEGAGGEPRARGYGRGGVGLPDAQHRVERFTVIATLPALVGEGILGLGAGELVVRRVGRAGGHPEPLADLVGEVGLRVALEDLLVEAVGFGLVLQRPLGLGEGEVGARGDGALGALLDHLPIPHRRGFGLVEGEEEDVAELVAGGGPVREHLLAGGGVAGDRGDIDEGVSGERRRPYAGDAFYDVRELLAHLLLPADGGGAAPVRHERALAPPCLEADELLLHADGVPEAEEAGALRARSGLLRVEAVSLAALHG